MEPEHARAAQYKTLLLHLPVLLINSDQRSITSQMSQCRESYRISSPRLSSSVEVEKNISVASSVNDMNPFAYPAGM